MRKSATRQSEKDRAQGEIPSTPSSLEDCLKQMKSLAQSCKQERSFASAVEACEVSRAAWASYLDRWLTNPNTHSRKTESDIQEGLEQIIQAVRECDRVKTLRPVAEREMVSRFIESIKFRLRLFELLCRDGVDAVRHELERRSRMLDWRSHSTRYNRKGKASRN